jgi:hypothetical protein
LPETNAAASDDESPTASLLRPTHRNAVAVTGNRDGDARGDGSHADVTR